MRVNSQDTPVYHNNDIIQQALDILSNRLRTNTITLNSPKDVKNFLTIKLAELEFEQFSIIYLDTQHKMIEFSPLFRGTLTQASVYPREVVKEAIKHNASAVILAHNHPSGNTAPSNADFTLTNTLKQALALIDVTVLDHIIIAGTNTYSFAEKGDI